MRKELKHAAEARHDLTGQAAEVRQIARLGGVPRSGGSLSRRETLTWRTRPGGPIEMTLLTKTRPFAKPTEAAEHHRQQDLQAYRDWLATADPTHRDALHVASLIRALERGPWDTTMTTIEMGGDDE